jgi:ferric-dicitrate binding protein FerR (iron transport regulator)
MSEQDKQRRDESLGEEIGAIVEREVNRVAESLRAEIDRLREEAAAHAQEAARGAGMLGAAGGLGLLSAGALASLPLLALRRLLPGWAVALLVAGGSAAGAALLAREGLVHLAAAAPQGVSESIERATEEVGEALKEGMSESRA